MATLGAKPNHAFFHCQHPMRKKPPQRASTTRRTNRRQARAPRPLTRAQRVRRSARKKKNIFFPEVLFAARVETRASASIGNGCDGAHRAYVPASERGAFVISSNGRFFVPHKPVCAKVRELFVAFRGAEAARRACQRRTDNADRDTFGRTTRSGFASRRLPEADRRGRSPPYAPFARCAKKKPLADDAGGFGNSGNAHRATPTRGKRWVSGRRLPGVRRSRPARADR
jgi:hypothetical protein